MLSFGGLILGVGGSSCCSLIEVYYSERATCLFFRDSPWLVDHHLCSALSNTTEMTEDYSMVFG